MKATLTKKYNFEDPYSVARGKFISSTVMVYFTEDGVFEQPIWIQIHQTKSSINCNTRVFHGEYNLRGQGSCSLDSSFAKHKAIKNALDEMGIETADFIFSEVSASLWICEATVVIAIAEALKLNSKRWTFVFTNGEDH